MTEGTEAGVDNRAATGGLNPNIGKKRIFPQQGDDPFRQRTAAHIVKKGRTAKNKRDIPLSAGQSRLVEHGFKKSDRTMVNNGNGCQKEKPCGPSESANGAGEGAKTHGTGAEPVDSAEGIHGFAPGGADHSFESTHASGVCSPAAPAVQGGPCEVNGGGASCSTSELGRAALVQADQPA